MATKTSTSLETDTKGNCTRHSYVQLRRLNHRTNEWVVLLDACPICRVEDDESLGNSSGSAGSNSRGRSIGSYVGGNGSNRNGGGDRGNGVISGNNHFVDGSARHPAHLPAEKSGPHQQREGHPSQQHGSQKQQLSRDSSPINNNEGGNNLIVSWPHQSDEYHHPIEHMTCYPCSTLNDEPKPNNPPTKTTAKASTLRRLSQSSLQTATTADTTRSGSMSRKSMTFHTDKNPYIVDAPHLLAWSGEAASDTKSEEFHHPLTLSALDNSSSSGNSATNGNGVPSKQSTLGTCETFETSAACSRDARSSVKIGSSASSPACGTESRISMALNVYRSLATAATKTAATDSCGNTGDNNCNMKSSRNQDISIDNQDSSSQQSLKQTTEIFSLKAPPLVPPGLLPQPPCRRSDNYGNVTTESASITTGNISPPSTTENEIKTGSNNDSFFSSSIKSKGETIKLATAPTTAVPLTPVPESTAAYPNVSSPMLGLRSFGGALSTITETPKPPKLEGAVPDPTCHRLDSSLAVPASLAPEKAVVDQADDDEDPDDTEEEHTDEEESVAETIDEDGEEEMNARERQEELDDLADRIKQHYAPLKTDMTTCQRRRSLSPAAVKLQKDELQSYTVAASSTPETSKISLQKDLQSPTARPTGKLQVPSSFVANQQILDAGTSNSVAKLNKQQRRHRSKERKAERNSGNQRRVLQQRSASQSHVSYRSGDMIPKASQSNPRRCRSFDQAGQEDKNNRSINSDHQNVNSSFTSRTSKLSHSSKSSNKSTRKKKKKDRQKNQSQHDDQQELQVVAANPSSQDENLIVNFPQKQRTFTALVDDGHNNNYDSKGRCIHHPFVRLRKKKLFGRGWKVLMKACPDCCVDELRRIRSSSDTLLKEQNKKKAVQHNDETSSNNMSSKNDTVDSGNIKKKSPLQRIGTSRRRESGDTASITQSSCSASSNGGRSMASSCIPPPGAAATNRAPSPTLRTSRQDSVRRNNVNRCNSNRAGRCGDPPGAVEIDVRSRRRNLSLQPARSRPITTPGNIKKQAKNNNNPHVRPSSMPPLSRPNSSLMTSRENTMSKKTNRIMHNNKNISHKQTKHVLQMEFTDINGKYGYYTGSVNQNLFPHGFGQMVYYDGTELEGDWLNGCWKSSGLDQVSNRVHQEGARSRETSDNRNSGEVPSLSSTSSRQRSKTRRKSKKNNSSGRSNTSKRRGHSTSSSLTSSGNYSCSQDVAGRSRSVDAVDYCDVSDKKQR